MSESKNAAYWLNKAVESEAKGVATGDSQQIKLGELALKNAIKHDEEEHKADPKTASLPRK